MKFQVTSIKFDFTGDDPDVEEVTLSEKNRIINEVKNSVWDADDEDDLIEEITAAYGWCILNVDYVHALS